MQPHLCKVRAHPLFYQLRALSHSSLRCVTGMVDPVFKTSFLDEWCGMPVNTRGSYVGTAFQMKLTKWLGAVQPGAWRKGEGSEPDVVCVYNPAWSFEVRASSNRGVTILGNKVQATSDKPPCYLLFVNYHPETVTVRDVRFGVCGPGDWLADSCASSQRARLSTPARDNFLRPPESGLELLATVACA
jgi:hypothetical protein